jgi:O-antigen ligase
VGLGLGASYRPLTPKDYENFDGRTFIHNGHVYILLKSGIFGYVGLLWFLLGVLVRGLRHWRRIPEPYTSGIVLAFALTSLGVLIVSLVEPYVMTSGWTPVIGVIAGINEVALKMVSQENSH